MRGHAEIQRLRLTLLIKLVEILERPYALVIRLKVGEAQSVKHAERLALSSLSALRAERWESALINARLSAAIHPRQSSAYVLLGLIYVNLGQRDRARRAYYRVASVQNSDAWTITSLGYLAVKLERYSEAEAVLRRALILVGDDADLLLHLGVALFQQGRYAEAVEFLERAHNLEPQNPTVLTDLGAARIEQGRLGEAVQVLTEAIQIDPPSVLAHFHLGRAFARMEMWEDALKEARAALKLEPEEIAYQENVELYKKGLAGELTPVNEDEVTNDAGANGLPPA